MLTVFLKLKCAQIWQLLHGTDEKIFIGRSPL